MSERHERPTWFRYVILGISVCMAILLYLDRYCLSTADRAIKNELGVTAVDGATVVGMFALPYGLGQAGAISRLGLTERQIASLLGAFFLPYALCQMPFGYLADRFGARRMLTFYLVTWSTCTGLMGIARGYLEFYLYRIGCGVFEAGGYPACAGIIKRWIPISQRGLASGIISTGGRLGGAITPKLTTALMAFFAAATPSYFSWQPTFIVYGLAGLLLAGVFWLIHRDHPQDHPWCNRAELDAIVGRSAATAESTSSKSVAFPWRGVLTHRSLWISSFIQFGANFGQVFLTTYLNRYLLEVHKVDADTSGSMGSAVVFIGTPALILGGLLTDALTRRFGQRWGRALPMALPRFVAAALFMCVPVVTWAMPEATLGRAWFVVILLGMVWFFADLTLSSIWAFNLDVGGRTVGLILAWGNMWGNLGGWRSPNDIQWIQASYGWDAVFFTCGGAFLAIALAALFIDSREKLADG
jgi:sugar phosphate permease